MPAKKTLQQREKELQALLATAAGRDELQGGGNPLPGGGRQGEVGGSLGRHLHPGPREGARPHRMLTEAMPALGEGADRVVQGAGDRTGESTPEGNCHIP